MRRVHRHRVAAPTSLSAPRKSDNKTELELATAHMEAMRAAVNAGGQRAKSFEFERYRDSAVKAALEQLFFGKCAYCESSYSALHPVDVEHYRPKNEVEGVSDHYGYWWLAMDWDNLLPSCIDCNRRRTQLTPVANEAALVELAKNGEIDRTKSILSGKQHAFPLKDESLRARWAPDTGANEPRLLLDPTRDDPEQHIVFHVDRSRLISIVYPKPAAAGAALTLPMPGDNPAATAMAAVSAGVSLEGAVSIQVYGLNRMGLVQARTRLLRDLEFLLHLSIELKDLAEEISTRLARKRGEVPLLAGQARTTAEADIATDEKIEGKLNEFALECLSRIRELTLPTAPYSQLALAWVRTYVGKPSAVS